MSDEGKTQFVRVLDVFLLGPLMVWAGMLVATQSPYRTSGVTLAVSGALTMWYNARNYDRIRAETGECGCLFRSQ